ncbi:Autophagy-related protein 36 [Candida viswanathii]|uniref:Autophagy-related protein 36 n=1 Tax=Candida viswanathii TaxID=5486 RepID=A0A367XKZ2_9ASCO|nr:Autophagy-related protein 36 [Candida viswanathii]
MNEDSQIDECMICLESILPTDKVGRIPCCPTKTYHDQCVLQWSRTSNSCPTCRQRFHKIEITDPQNTVEVVSIQDRLLPNDAINDIPLQFIIREQPPTNPSVDDYEPVEETCYICSNVSSRSGISCQQCGCPFHLNCLGVMGTLEESICWCCPICDYNQESIVPQRLIRRMQNIPRTQSARPRRQEQRNRLVIHNDNDELDVDFLYEDEDVSYEELHHGHVGFMGYHSPVINGGVISRREQKQRAQLTQEEVQSWEMFDVARKENEDVVGEGPSISEKRGDTTDDENASNKRRRKRKKVTPVESCSSSTANQTTSHSTSRISQLIDQLKTTSKRTTTTVAHQTIMPQTTFLLPSTSSSTAMLPNDSPMSISPAANSPMELVSYSSDDNDYTRQLQKQKPPMRQPNKELTLDQKIEIQKHIRNKLRPRYKPGKTSSEHNPEVITSEENYININKTISRKIYNHILSQPEPIDDFFKDDDLKLRDVIDKYIE